MKRIVLDTNVTISAIFWKGHPRAIYDLVHNKKLTISGTGIKIVKLKQFLLYEGFLKES